MHGAGSRWHLRVRLSEAANRIIFEERKKDGVRKGSYGEAEPL